jgi:hypothetical protein
MKDKYYNKNNEVFTVDYSEEKIRSKSNLLALPFQHGEGV